MLTIEEVAALGVINHQDAKRAHSVFARALAKGTLTRRPCEITGEEPAEGHHFDYARPLDVIWLRTKEHRAVHVAINELPSSKQLRAALMIHMGKAGVLKLREVAERADLDPRAVNLTPGTTIATLQKIAKALKCKPADLLAEVEAES